MCPLLLLLMKKLLHLLQFFRVYCLRLHLLLLIFCDELHFLLLFLFCLGTMGEGARLVLVISLAARETDGGILSLIFGADVFCQRRKSFWP